MHSHRLLHGWLLWTATPVSCYILHAFDTQSMRMQLASDVAAAMGMVQAGCLLLQCQWLAACMQLKL